MTLMAAPLREVSIKDYQHKWSVFIDFLRHNEVPFREVTLSHVLRFLTHLFHVKRLKPNTVARYRSALSVPLRVGFLLDLGIPVMTDLFRAMNLQRPSIPSSAPAWSLSKVLRFLESLPFPLSATMLLRKTAFLLMLATRHF